jgi:hypothetical protein
MWDTRELKIKSLREIPVEATISDPYPEVCIEL